MICLNHLLAAQAAGQVRGLHRGALQRAEVLRVHGGAEPGHLDAPHVHLQLQGPGRQGGGPAQASPCRPGPPFLAHCGLRVLSLGGKACCP